MSTLWIGLRIGFDELAGNGVSHDRSVVNDGCFLHGLVGSGLDCCGYICLDDGRTKPPGG